MVAGAAALAVACSPTTTNGQAHRAESDGATGSTSSAASPTSAAPALVPSAKGPDLLLKRGELAEIIGEKELTELQAYTEPRLMATKIEPWACMSRAIVTSEGLTANKPAVTGNVNRGVGERTWQSVEQAVAIFQSPHEVAQALTYIEDHWRRCHDGDIFFIEVGADNQRWVPYPVSNESGRLGTTIKRDGLPRNCHQVAVGKANVVVESMVCRDDDATPAANTVADRILAKIPG
ncbi:sensor domain-containing protein [Mycobacterium sp. NPDC003449]